MRRRQFLAALGGMAAGPLASYAQGPGLPLIGYLGPEAPERFASRVNAFRDGLAETGYIEGRNVVSLRYRASAIEVQACCERER
jgi:putative tryptophan/tyrosine transport system substrate-binding protein